MWQLFLLCCYKNNRENKRVAIIISTKTWICLSVHPSVCLHIRGLVFLYNLTLWVHSVQTGILGVKICRKWYLGVKKLWSLKHIKRRSYDKPNVALVRTSIIVWQRWKSGGICVLYGHISSFPWILINP